MSYNYTQTADGATYSSYYDVTADGDYTNDYYDKTSDGAYSRGTDTGNSGGYFTNYYGYFVDSGWYYSNYTDKTSSYNSKGTEISFSTSYYDSTVDGNYTNDYQSKTAGGDLYKQTDTGNYGDYYFAYSGTDQSTYTDKSAYYNSKGTETSQYTSYYASTADGDYTTDTNDKTTDGSVYKSTDTGNYGYYAYDYYGFYDYGWVSDNYTDKSESINSSGVVVGNTTSYYNATAGGNYTNDYNSLTSGGDLYKQTDTGSYGVYDLYSGTHDAYSSDRSAYYSDSGSKLVDETTSYYASTADGGYTSDSNNLTSGGDVYKSTDTGNYGYYDVDYGYYGYYGFSGYYGVDGYYSWTASTYTDKSEEYNSQGVEVSNSTSYYDLTAYGAYTDDYYSKSSGGDVYKSTDTGNYGVGYDNNFGFYYGSNFTYYGGDELDKTSSYNSSGEKTSASTSYYDVTTSGNWVDDYQYQSSGGIYKTTDTGNYGSGEYTDTTQYFNSAGTRTGYSTTSGT